MNKINTHTTTASSSFFVAVAYLLYGAAKYLVPSGHVHARDRAGSGMMAHGTDRHAAGQGPGGYGRSDSAQTDQPQPAAGPERDHPYGMDVPGVLAACDELAARIERHRLDDLPPADLAPRLLA